METLPDDEIPDCNSDKIGVGEMLYQRQPLLQKITTFKNFFMLVLMHFYVRYLMMMFNAFFFCKMYVIFPLPALNASFTLAM